MAKTDRFAHLCEPAVLPSSTVVSHELCADLRLILQHFIVASVSGEAAGVILVQDLDLKPPGLEASQQVLARIIAGRECRSARAGGPVVVLLCTVLVPDDVAMLCRLLGVGERICCAVRADSDRHAVQVSIRYVHSRANQQPERWRTKTMKKRISLGLGEQFCSKSSASPPVQTCPATCPTGFRRAHGVLPAIGNEALMRLSIAAMNVVDQPPAETTSLFTTFSHACPEPVLANILFGGIKGHKNDVSRTPRESCSAKPLIALRFRVVGCEYSWLEEVSQCGVALILPLQKPPMIDGAVSLVLDELALLVVSKPEIDACEKTPLFSTVFMFVPSLSG
jgi:hypothetical protein